MLQNNLHIKTQVLVDTIDGYTDSQRYVDLHIPKANGYERLYFLFGFKPFEVIIIIFRLFIWLKNKELILCL